MPGPLAGLRVLDLSRHLPGPYATLLFADLGAEVVKVEDREGGGDPVRHLPPLAGDAGGVFFHALNRGKRSVALDLKSEDGRAGLRALAATADVLVESFRPGVLDRLGVGLASLRQSCPRLVTCSLSGFGEDGPDRLRAGHDLGYLARAGGLGLAGEPHAQQESWPGFQAADVAGGSLMAAVGILAKLRERDATGQGGHVECSLAEGALSLLHMHVTSQRTLGEGLQRGVGPLNGGLPCYGLYRCADGRQIAIAALEPKFWLGFCAAVGRDELGTHGYDKAARAELEALFRTRSRDEWVALGRAHDVCLEPVWEGDELFSDPQHVARGVFVDVPDPRLPGGVLRTLRTPLRLGPPALTPAPGLGADTREELAKTALDPATIERLSR